MFENGRGQGHGFKRKFLQIEWLRGGAVGEQNYGKRKITKMYKRLVEIFFLLIHLGSVNNHT